MFTNLKIAFRFIFKSPFQALLLLLTITLGISTQLFIISLTVSLEELVDEMALANNTHITLMRKAKDPGFNNDLINEIKQLDNVKFAAGQTVFRYLFSKDGEVLDSINLTYFTDDLRFILDFEHNIVSGDNSGLNTVNELYLSSYFAAEHNIKVGEEVLINSASTNYKQSYTIKGIYKPPTFNPHSNDFAYALSPSRNSWHTMFITIDDLDLIDETISSFLDIVDPSLTTIYKYDSRYETQVLFQKAQNITFIVIQVFITSIIILVSYSIFDYFVARKTRQLGILKALGHGQKQIAKILLLITFIIGSVANILAVFVSRFGLNIFQKIMTFEDGTKRINIIVDIKLFIVSIILVFVAIGFSTILVLRKTKKVNIITLIKES